MGEFVNIDYKFTPEEKTRQQKEYKFQCHIVKKHRIHFADVEMIAYQARPSGITDEARKLDAHFKKQMGVKAGVTDCLLWWTPHWIKNPRQLHHGLMPIQSGVVELKVDTDVSRVQDMWMSGFYSRGGYTGVAHSWKEYYKLLCSFGIMPTSPCTVFDEPDYRTDANKKQDAFDWQKPI